MIRVLEIVPSMRVDNGVISFLMNYLRKIDHSEIIVDFVTFDLRECPYVQEIRDYGGEFYLLPSVSSFSKHYKECIRILNENSYDVVHNNALTKSLPIMRCAKKMNIPVRILHSHNASLGNNSRNKIMRKCVLNQLINLSTDLAACSKAAGKCYFGEKEYTLINNIVDDQIFNYRNDIRETIREKFGVKDKIVICSVGRMAMQKNPFFAMDVISVLFEKHKNIVYWWMGTGPLEEKMKEYAHKKGLDSIITFWGGRSDINDLYQAADVFFLPSLFEGLPVTGVESQLMGLPSVISDSVTDEMVFTDLIEFVSLDSSLDTWQNAFERQFQRIPARRSYKAEFDNSAYSPQNAGSFMMGYFKSLLDVHRNKGVNQ